MAAGLFISVDKVAVKSLIKALEELPIKLQKSAAKATLRAGAKPVLSAMKSRVPVDTGLLKKSLGIGIVGAKRRDYWGFGKIGPRRGYKSKKSLTGRARERAKKGKRSTWVERKMLDMQELSYYIETGTPNMTAKPFIRPAIDASQGEVLTAMSSGLEKHLTRVAARLKNKR